ncbi:hypothetical protein PCH_Pc20g07130 [Penicillium rubens Wisconsin 54-1255]|uniref:Uncharacterized protein n=1 Tax=Penicillium rubens (strain ATCC 28089 / DSM 1075 / NRRL 1951 / Wisconsin 54-1255) TaxID=500485 RepID=B6HDD8_PENRW|nr:hypothetical protein PCH_Pc20g07130 [Penicillium rubens Wisconsin 54-1255]
MERIYITLWWSMMSSTPDGVEYQISDYCRGLKGNLGATAAPAKYLRDANLLGHPGGCLLFQITIIHNGHGWKCEPCSGNPKTLVPLLMQQRGYRHTELKTVVEKTMYQIMYSVASIKDMNMGAPPGPPGGSGEGYLIQLILQYYIRENGEGALEMCRSFQLTGRRDSSTAFWEIEVEVCDVACGDRGRSSITLFGKKSVNVGAPRVD